MLIAAMRPARFVVLGGGIAGLSAAHKLSSACPRAQVVLVEASSRLGGWLWSERRDDFLFERGCRGIRPSGASGTQVIELIDELGLGRVTLSTAAQSSPRFIWQSSERGLEEVPSSIFSALRSPLTRDALAWALRDIFAPSRAAGAAGLPDDESVSSFASRHFGEHVTRVLLDAALGGIHAGDIDALSARSVLSSLWEAQARGVWAGGRYSSVLLGLLRAPHVAPPSFHTPPSPPSATAERLRGAASISFTDGVGALPRALEACLRKRVGVELLTSYRAESLEVCGRAGADGSSASVRVRVSPLMPCDGGQRVLEADAVICALPAAQLAPLLAASSGRSRLELATAGASAQPRANVGVVSLAWRHAPGPTIASAAWCKGPLLPKPGFGYLVPRKARPEGAPPVLGATFDSSVFPGQALGNAPETRVTVMLGGATHDISGWSHAALERAALDSIRAQAGVNPRCGTPPHALLVTVANAAIPQYTVGHASRMADVFDGVRDAFSGRVLLVGNSWAGVGAADSIAGGRSAAARVLSESGLT